LGDAEKVTVTRSTGVAEKSLPCWGSERNVDTTVDAACLEACATRAYGAKLRSEVPRTVIWRII
jgi:hypothetical protein